MSAASDGDVHRRRTVVVGVDFQPRSDPALRHALSMFSHGIVHEVHVVHIIEHERFPSRAKLEECAEFAAHLTAAFLPTATGAAFAHAGAGRASEELVRLAHDVSASMIIVGDRSDGRAIETERFTPFSLMHAGTNLAIECRSQAKVSCPDCTHIRAGSPEMFCMRHTRPDRVSRRVGTSAPSAWALH